MRKITITITALIILTASGLMAQEQPPIPDNPIDSIVWYLNDKHFDDADSLVDVQLQKNPNSAILLYLKGQSLQHLCYDFVPYRGFTENTSDSIIEYFEQALAIDDTLYSAKFFIGVERGERMLRALYRKDYTTAQAELEAGYASGAYPDWLLEYARNTLKSCDSNAVLFVGGDLESFPLWYVQIIQDYRTDVTVLPMSLMNGAQFVLSVKEGLFPGNSTLPTSWTDLQIMSGAYYHWPPDTLALTIDAETIEEFTGDRKPETLFWELGPDLSTFSERYMSMPRALVIDIVQTNDWKRPLYMSTQCPKIYFDGLQDHMQRKGLVLQILPIDVKKRDMELDNETIKKDLLDPDSYIYFKTVADNPIPGVEPLLINYHINLIGLVQLYHGWHEYDESRRILDFVKEYLPFDAYPANQRMRDAVDYFDKKLTEEDH